ncbi:MAG TPA: matrixin family metalloprotease [Candidatus Paceibacterota bacterium]|nr:matrixin family metalloprotease [Candidatus Paceibacterota bacterium]
MRTSVSMLVRYLVLVAVAGLCAHVVLARPEVFSLFKEEKACAEPITYAIQAYDPRFNISEAEFESAVSEATEFWNAEYGEPLLAVSESGSVSVSLVYDDRQRALELGEEISEEQDTYTELRAEIDALRSTYYALRTRYKQSVDAFDADVAAYEEEVERWNDRGGAPPAVYAQLAVRKAELSERQSALGSQAVRVERAAKDINVLVDSLNALVSRININAETFNETLGHDFDQGNYVVDGETRVISIYTFETREELVRVLAHEFGHALGIGHVENPDSLMYSYNFGGELALTEEDREALRLVCGA